MSSSHDQVFVSCCFVKFAVYKFFSNDTQVWQRELNNFKDLASELNHLSCIGPTTLKQNRVLIGNLVSSTKLIMTTIKSLRADISSVSPS